MPKHSALEPQDLPEIPEPRPRDKKRMRHGKRNYSVALLSAAVAVLVGVGAVGSWAMMSRKTVEISVDGKVQEVTTWGATVGDILKENDIDIDSHDFLEPKASQVAESGEKITVRTAKEIKMLVDGQEKEYWTTALSAADAVKEMGFHEARMLIDQEASQRRQLPIVTEKSVVKVIHDGTQTDVTAAARETIKSLVKKAKLTLGGSDKVWAQFDAAGNASVQVVRVAKERITVDEDIPYGTDKTTDDSMYTDEKQVLEAGVLGSKKVTKDVVKEDGNIVSENIVSAEVTKQPVNEKVKVGTKARPAPDYGGVDGVWAALARCECGGNPACNTGNGYYGMYQFSLPTWHSVGGQGLPSEASAEEQTHRAQILQARSGWGQWPACARSLGLL